MRNNTKASGIFNGVVKAIAYAAAGSLVIVSLVFAFIMLRPVDVLSNWKLGTTETVYHPGDELILISTVNKLMNVNGEAKRTLVCFTNGVEESYDLPDQSANRTSGPHAMQIVIALPQEITKLPRVCHIMFNIDYVVYGIRHFPESTNSNDFTIEQKPGE